MQSSLLDRRIVAYFAHATIHTNMIYFIALIICLILLYYLFNGAIPLPTHRKAILVMLNLAGPVEGLRVAELGSGDGRIAAAFAQAGATVDAYEVNPILSLWSKWRLRKQSNVDIYTRSFWSVNLSQYDVIVVFGMTHIMERLRMKLERELKPGVKVISNIFEIPGWTPEKDNGGVKLYIRR